MNSKLIKASLAGVAALALAAGGTTFAAWSDFGTVSGNETEAGHLRLDLANTGVISNVGGNAIAPGESRTIDYFIASSDLDGVPSAALTMNIANLVDSENGCGRASESAVDNCAAGDPGEFSGQGYVRVRYSAPVAANTITYVGNECKINGLAPALVNSLGYSPASDNNSEVYPKLAALTGAQALGTLTGNQGVCLRIDLGLPVSATNAVQTDSSTFDLRFDLTQI